MVKVDFILDGNEKDYKKVINNIMWLLGECLDKDVEKVTIEVKQGDETNYIKGLVTEVFSETGIVVNIV